MPAPIVSGAHCDVVVRRSAAAPIPPEQPPGRLLAGVGNPDGAGYTLVRGDAAYLLRIHGLADFRISPALTDIDVVASPHLAAGMVPLLLAGNVLATLLTLAGEQVLHASAVALDGRGLGFVGHSGSGKSTLAALFCAAAADTDR